MQSQGLFFTLAQRGFPQGLKALAVLYFYSLYQGKQKDSHWLSRKFVIFLCLRKSFEACMRLSQKSSLFLSSGKCPLLARSKIPNSKDISKSHSLRLFSPLVFDLTALRSGVCFSVHSMDFTKYLLFTTELFKNRGRNGRLRKSPSG